MSESESTRKDFPDWENPYKSQSVETMPWYNERFDSDLERELDQRNIIAKGKNFLDLGTGPATQAIWLVKRGFNVSKLKFIQQEASKGNVLAKQYLEKLRKEEVSIDWAHRAIINSIRQQRMLKMMAIADDRQFSYDNEIELVQFIASEMQKEGLDLNNEENLDSYLNTKFM